MEYNNLPHKALGAGGYPPCRPRIECAAPRAVSAIDLKPCPGQVNEETVHHLPDFPPKRTSSPQLNRGSRNLGSHKIVNVIGIMLSSH